MSHTRFTRLGVAGRKDSANNSQDTYLQTFEFPVVAVASGAAQDTGVPVPTGTFQTVSAYLLINTAEVTGTTKTVTVGTTTAAGSILGATDVSATGPEGTPVQAATAGGGNFAYTLGSANFAELDAVCVVTLLCSD